MGKGDKKTRRGKIIIGSFGVRRPNSSKRKSFVKTEADPVAATEKEAVKPKAEKKSKVKAVETTEGSVTAAEATPAKTAKKTVKKSDSDKAVE